LETLMSSAGPIAPPVCENQFEGIDSARSGEEGTVTLSHTFRAKTKVWAKDSHWWCQEHMRCPYADEMAKKVIERTYTVSCCRIRAIIATFDVNPGNIQISLMVDGHIVELQSSPEKRPYDDLHRTFSWGVVGDTTNPSNIEVQIRGLQPGCIVSAALITDEQWSLLNTTPH
jgi:hypothetical protein